MGCKLISLTTVIIIKREWPLRMKESEKEVKNFIFVDDKCYSLLRVFFIYPGYDIDIIVASNRLSYI